MADETPVADARPECGWVKAYHSSGLLVTILVRGADPAEIFKYVDSIVAAGFLAAAPGLEAGEEKDLVAFVVQGSSENNRGEVTPFVLLYNANDAYKFSFLKVYLNKPDDVAAFEAAASMKISDFPIYVGQDKPERGKNKQVDRFIVPVRTHFGVVFKANPKWTQEAADAAKATGAMYAVPRRVFVRWADQKPKAEQAATPAAANLDTIRKKWKDFFIMDPPLDVFNRFCKDNWDEVPAGMQGPLNKAIQVHADMAQWKWDGVSNEYFKPLTQPASEAF